jgi:glycosyltransferase involved in cell wall biosynthesis
MKLCWLIDSAGGGGGASVALSCCRQAAAAGHDTTLLVRGPIEDWLEEYAHSFRLTSLDNAEGEKHRAPKLLLDWLTRNPQDVLLHNDVQPVNPAFPHLPEELRLVFVVHDTAKMYWDPAVQNERYLDAIVTVSNVIARQFRSRLDDPRRLHVAHNGTLFPDDVALDQERADDLVFLGGGKHIKGAYDVLNVWQSLVEQGFDGVLHWFGTVGDELKEKIRGLPASDQIDIRGYTPRSEIFEAAARSKVLLMLSRVEPFGMVTVECMGMGCLPVAWDVETGTQEIVTHGETGFFAPLGDADALAHRIRTALHRHEGLHETAINRARSTFSEEAMWDRYAEVLKAVRKRPVADRPHAGEPPPPYEPPTRYFQLLPEGVRNWIRSAVGRSPWLGYLLRDMRGL